MNIQFSTSSTSMPSKLETGASPSNSEASLRTITGSKTNTDLGHSELIEAHMSIGQEELIRRIEAAVKILEGPQTTLDIRIHEKTHQLMVKVLNKETGELIREVPKEKTLDLVAKMMEIAGLMVDERI